jgi:hypothetical protein
VKLRRRALFAAAVAVGLLTVPGTASAHQGSAAKARKYLAKVVNAADSARVTSGAVRVSGCKAKRGQRAHGHAFVCRVAVQQVYPNGSSRTCRDKSVTVLRTKRGYRRVMRTYMNRADSRCGRLRGPQLPAQGAPAPHGSQTPAPATPAETPPVSATGNPSLAAPSGAPSGFPPLPGMSSKSAGKAQARASALGYSNGFYYPWYYANGYAWLVEKWYFQGPGCNADYYRFWWWNGYGWAFYSEYWVLNAYYTQDQVLYSQPC